MFNYNYKNKNLIIVLLSLFLLFSFSSQPVHAKSNQPSFWQKVKNAAIYPFEKILDMVTDTKREHMDKINSDNPNVSLEETDKTVEQYEQIPEETRYLGEEGVEEISGIWGTLKEAKEFFTRLFQKQPEQETDPQYINDYTTLGYDWKGACSTLFKNKRYNCKSGPCSCLSYYQEKEKETILDCHSENTSLKDCLDQKAFLANPQLKNYWHIGLVKKAEITQKDSQTDYPPCTDQQRQVHLSAGNQQLSSCTTVVQEICSKTNGFSICYENLVKNCQNFQIEIGKLTEQINCDCNQNKLSDSECQRLKYQLESTYAAFELFTKQLRSGN